MSTIVMPTTISERELFRCQVKQVSGQVEFKNATCVLTNKRVLLSDDQGRFAQILFSDVVEVEPLSGRSIGHGVVIKTRTGLSGSSSLYSHVMLAVETKEDMYRLASQITQALMQM